MTCVQEGPPLPFPQHLNCRLWLFSILPERSKGGALLRHQTEGLTVSLLLLTTKPETAIRVPSHTQSLRSSKAQLCPCVYLKAHLHNLDCVPSTHSTFPSCVDSKAFPPPLLPPQPSPVFSRIASGDNVLQSQCISGDTNGEGIL